MRFSRLEIKGFKSFANETVIHFNEDVTGIVGPNGSGKSNIVDAIRWVLGEQKSAELRLDKMASVIFNGTKSKKPSGMAQVSLVFENDKKILPIDFNEVKITRVLYQNGESEYKLNNVTCRLKDIYSLFVDTGVGSNTYAIIGFGMVEDLLNNKDNYRRMMIEQAAGISKYKSRKKETLSKLQTTMDDLNRVDDLLSEIESNMNTLRKQARRAEKFLELRAKYKENASIVFKHQKITIKENILAQQIKYEQEKSNAEAKEIEIHNLEAKIETQRNNLLEKEEALSEFQRKTNTILEEQKALEKKRDLAIQRMSFIKSRSDQSIKDLEKLSENISQITIQRQNLLDQIPGIEEESNKLKETLLIHEKKFNELKTAIGSIETNTTPILAQFEAQNARLFALEKENAIAQSQLLTIQSDTGKNKVHGEELKANLSQLEAQIQSIVDSKNEILNSINKATEEINAQNVILTENKSKLEELKEKKKTTERKSDNLTHEIKLLRSLIDNQEGYPEAVKYLSANMDKSKDFQLLADLINCDEQYRTALENYLAPYLTHFVVKNYNEAFDAINLLSSSQKGKAGFIVLEAFNEKTPAPVIIPDATPLSALVQCHPQYVKLFNQLLKDAYIVNKVGSKSFEELKNNHSYSFVAIDGSVIVSNGHASGGSIGLVEGSLLGRKIRLEKLEDEVKEQKKLDSDLFIKISDVEESIDILTKNSKVPELENLQRKMQTFKESELQLNVKIDNSKTQLQKIFDSEAELNKKLETYNGVIANNSQPIVDTKNDIERLNTEVLNNRSELKSKTDEYNTESSLVNSYKMNIIQSDNRKDSLVREASILQQQINNQNESSKQLNNTQQQSVLEISALETSNAETENSIIEISNAFKASQNELSEVEKMYFTEKKSVNEEEQAVRLKQRELSSIQTIANEWKDKWQGSQYELKRIEDNFEIEFGQNYVEPEDSEEPVDLKSLEDQNAKIKNSILQFGEVNPLALEAYNEIKIRYDEIVVQKNDILESKDMLAQTLNELENTSTTKYLAAFNTVRDNFKMVFRSLFTEDDDCDLVIEQEGSPLDSDIAIIAKPKGKRPQSLSQLSGGEKTLTAIAFLFSLYLLKPAPFCIFDELDAPLDDVNVEKLNKIIRKFSTQSQFIIITHNKATMASVDIMYGVYMEQQGISGLSKVDFRSYDHNMILEKVES